MRDPMHSKWNKVISIEGDKIIFEDNWITSSTKLLERITDGHLYIMKSCNSNGEIERSKSKHTIVEIENHDLKVGDLLIGLYPSYRKDQDDMLAEIEKCKDPVYFYEKYVTVNGQKPAPLREYEKELMRDSILSEQLALRAYKKRLR